MSHTSFIRFIIPLAWLKPVVLWVAFALLAGFTQHLVAEETAGNLYLKLIQQPSESSLEEIEELLESYQKPDVLIDINVSPFHKREAVTEAADNSFCQACHTQWPHRKQLRTRAMLNKHTQSIACETCHLRPKTSQLSYTWWDYGNKSPVASEQHPFTAGNESNPEQHRIIPLFQAQPALIFADHPEAQTMLNHWEDAPTTKEKAKLHIQLHAPLTKDKTDCRSCHQSKQPLLDLNELGASEEQIQTIENNPIANFFERYKSEDERIQILKLLR